MPIKSNLEESRCSIVECNCMQEDEPVEISPTRTRKKIFYMNFEHIEFGDQLNDLELLTREKLLTRHVWERMVFWLDLEEALKTLTKKQQRCFSLRHIEGYSETEIAKMLRLDQSTVSQHIVYAIEKVKIFLQGYP